LKKKKTENGGEGESESAIKVERIFGNVGDRGTHLPDRQTGSHFEM